MAFTGSPTDSTQRAAQRSAVKIDQHDWSRMQIAYFSYTHAAGAGVGFINLLKLPAGKIRVFTDLSRIMASAMVATADLHLGHRAYKDPDTGLTVAEDNIAFADNLDAGAVIDEAWSLPLEGAPIFTTKDGFEIFVEIDTANIEDTDTIKGWIVYARGG